MSEEIVLKSREDRKPIILTEGEDNKYTSKSSDDHPWAKGEINNAVLRSRIEPWLTALFQSEHFSLLVGAGLTEAVLGLVRYDDKPKMPTPQFSEFKEQIEKASKVSDGKNLTTTGIELQLQVAHELLVGLKHLHQEDKNPERISRLESEITEFLKKFSEYILELENKIVDADDEKRAQAFNYLVNFLTSFASRSGTRDRLQIFTTNYERVIETGAEIAGLRLLDRFVGSVSPIFRSSRLNVDMHYNPPGIRGEPRYLEGVVHFTKLHGSIDWRQLDKDIRRIGLPFGAESLNPYLEDSNKLMIYPNAAKDKETVAYPYVEMFRDFAASICRPNNTLVTYGYSYSDDHINRIIKDMLTIPSTHLVIISYDKEDKIMAMYEDIGRPAQITLLLGKDLAGLKPLVDNYLPKAAIDRVTSRMVDLLKSRLEIESNSKNKTTDFTKGILEPNLENDDDLSF